MVASTVGSPTSTFWKRRSSAASFQRTCGIRRAWCADAVQLAARPARASTCCPHPSRPQALPAAPTMVQFIDEDDGLAGVLLQFLPIPPSSALRIRRGIWRPPAARPYPKTRLACPSRTCTSPLTIRCASPSTMAVFPTPGSPISTGCSLCAVAHLDGAADFVVATNHGSSLPVRARSVRSIVYF